MPYLCRTISGQTGYMISKNKVKALRMLENKKHRRQTGLFVAEGPKVVGDLLEKAPAQTIVATQEWWHAHPTVTAAEAITVDAEELRRVSFLQHPQQVMATFPLPANEETPDASAAHIASQLCLALDSVQDPGNLGTIIRIADWFGIEHIYCSADTADAYSPKVVQATMGSISRVRLVYTDLCSLIDLLPAETPVYGTMLDGTDLYDQELTPHGLLVMGNEGNGISPAVASRVTHHMLIPPYPAGRDTADSLNVAIATAICCAEFRRRQQKK